MHFSFTLIDTTNAVARLLAPQQVFLACGSKEGTFFFFRFGGKAAKTKETSISALLFRFWQLRCQNRNNSFLH